MEIIVKKENGTMGEGIQMLQVYGLTFDHTTNYGSCFQAYALQSVIDGIEINGEKCNYQLIPISQLVDLAWDTGFIRLVKKVFYIIHRLQFKEFEKKYMKFVNVTGIEELPLLNHEADAFVCGSDVIWNPLFNRNLGVFYLDFVKKYKFSYAASFGTTELDLKNSADISSKLQSFNEISCREKSGVELVKKLADIDAELVADPVLLLKKHEWNQILERKSRRAGRYIFVYITRKNKNLTEFVDRLHKLTGFKIIRSAFTPGQVINQRILQVQKPEKWLSLLRDAAFVVTNSYHATVFSVIFHKKFFAVLSSKETGRSNIRMNDFLNDLGLGNRVIYSIPSEIDLSEINFQHADKVVKDMRKKSMNYIRRNLNNAYDQKES